MNPCNILASACPQDICIHQWFESQVKCIPDLVAIEFGDQQLTYSELNKRSNQLARYLRKLNVGHEVLVGLCVHRSLEMVIGILGILKAGGAYVPLDPLYPSERLEYMISDSKVSVLLTQKSLSVQLFDQPTYRTVYLDIEWEFIAKESEQNLANKNTYANLVYVVYTSGSTGKPKGVAMSHYALANLILWQLQNTRVGSQAKTLQFAPISFDVSFQEIFSTLCAGGILVLITDELRRDSLALIHLLSNKAVKRLFLPFVALRQLVEVAEACKFYPDSLCEIIVAGEQLQITPAIIRFFDKLHSCTLHNQYGPSETHVVTAYTLKGSASTWPALPPIGRPIINTEAYVLDESLQPVEVGVEGELYLGGVCLARGYLNRPELTLEKFIANPFKNSPEASPRLYKTGDLARYLPDGNLQYIGRTDSQVKIRGYRVELGEIEATISKNLAVQQAVVMAREGTSNSGKRLVAYVVPRVNDEGITAVDKDLAYSEQMSQWQELWDMAYQKGHTEHDRTLNSSGWNNSYTGAPIPAAEMQEWVEVTVARILSYQPRRVLEIGCGSGMLLFRIAPYCQYYYGTDVAPMALRYIEQVLQKRDGDWSHITLKEGEAVRILQEVGTQEFDTIIINSVVELFPSIDYLLGVVEKAVSLIEPEGQIFIGDSRSLLSLKAFHSSVQLYRSPGNITKQELQEQIQKSIEREKQLVVDPAFFRALKFHLPQISQVEIQLRRGNYHNEMTKFRYDAVIHVIGETKPSSVDPVWLDWQKDNLTLALVCSYLTANQPDALGIYRILDMRIATEVRLLEYLENNSIATVEELRQLLQEQDRDGVDPEDWWCLASQFPYKIQVMPSSILGYYDVLFQNVKVSSIPNLSEEPQKPWAVYANEPLKSQLASQLEIELRNYVEQCLPDYMRPSTFIILDEMPLTPSGKVNRKALPIPDSRRPELGTDLVLPQNETEQAIAKIWQSVLEIEIVGINDSFFDLGGNSLLLAQVYRQLIQDFDPSLLSIVDLFQYPTVKTLANYLDDSANLQLTPQQKYSRLENLRVAPRSAQSNSQPEIAVIGISCRFPGAQNPDEFWQNLCKGIDSISILSDEEIEIADRSLLQQSNYVKAAAALPDIEQFDASFFGYSAKEAALMDPQQRIFLESAWEAVESAGYNPELYPGLIGIYAGAGMNTYLINNVHPSQNFSLNRIFLTSSQDLQIRLANAGGFLSTRVSYKLNLNGPSLFIQTACSTSLVAVHLATQALLNGECDMAIAGGIAISVPQKTGYPYQENMIWAPDGKCRAFDADARGTVPGNGVGVVVLKLLDQAIEDRDNIHAVIKGSAINNDGSAKVGYTAPSVNAQAAVISQALALSKVDPSTINYVEAHGTGTVLGDPIEIAALTQSFRKVSVETNPEKPTGYCAIGSVKTNIGHLAEAAGIAGFIKTVLMLKYKQIPPSLNFSRPNPNIDFSSSPFYVNTELSTWSQSSIPCRAGVSSFGMGGTNCHVVLQESPKQELTEHDETKERPLHLLALSAKTDKALSELVRRYLSFFKLNPEVNLANVCFTANTGRKHFNHRLAVVVNSNSDLAEQLTASPPYSQLTDASNKRKIAFLFSGQGSQYIGMGHHLYETQPTFRRVINYCNEIIQPVLGKSLLDILYPQANSPHSNCLHETLYTQPALFALEYALFELWKSWGIHPDIVIGHSVGEYVAACVAGVFSLEDGLKLITERARLMQALPPNGGMMSILASKEQVRDLISPYDEREIAIAAINGPQSIVISGSDEVLNIVGQTLESQGIKTKRLEVSHAFHSPFMEPVLADFENFVQQFAFSAPQIPLIANLTGELMTLETLSREYWSLHIRHPIQFASSIEKLGQENIEVFLEIGPKATLLGMARQCLPLSDSLWLPSLRPQADWQQLLTSLATLYTRGIPIDWLGFDHDYDRFREDLPTYPFQRQRYWIEAVNLRIQEAPHKTHMSKGQEFHPLLGQRLVLAGTHDLRFQAEISQTSPAWLQDHCIFDSVLLPATGYAEIALAAGNIAFGGVEGLALEDVSLERALIVSAEETKTIQTVLIPQEENYKFEIYSFSPKTSSENPWVLHAAGKLLKTAKSTTVTHNLKTFQEQTTEKIPCENLYQIFHQQGMNYGPSFKAMVGLWRTETMALGQIELSGDLAIELQHYHMHPVVLDTCMQVLEILTHPDTNESQEMTYVPVSFERLEVYGHPERYTWAHGQLQKAEEKHLLADFVLFAPDGKVLATLTGLRLRKISNQSLEAIQNTKESWFYELEWRIQKRSTELSTSSNGDRKRKNWLIFGNSQNMGYQLATLLNSQGDDAVLVSLANEYTQVANKEIQLDPTNVEHLTKLLSTFTTIDGIVQLTSVNEFNPKTSADLEQASKISCGATITLIQELIKQCTNLPRLYLVTQGAKSVQGEPIPGISQSSLWGMGKAINLEHPQFHSSLIDLDPHSPDSNIQNLFEEISSSFGSEQREYEIAFRSGERYVARLVHSAKEYSISQEDSLESASFSLRSDRSYLIAGGLGDLGLLVANWLVKHGARQLILVGRSQPSSSAMSKIQELESYNAEIIIVQADISHPLQMSDVLTKLEKTTQPLAGIYHTAVSLDDGTVEQLSWDRFEKVMAPKVKGAWNLHILTRNQPLDFFVVFSSIASLFGSAGQASYCAANTFLDALIAHRRAIGLSGIAINWGPWSEIGIAARSPKILERLSDMGMKSINIHQGLQALTKIMLMRPSHIGVVPVDWDMFRGELWTVAALFDDLVNIASPLAQKPGDSRDLLKELETLPIEQCRDLITSTVRSLIAKVLAFKHPEQIEPGQRLIDLGLDSLMSIELRNYLQSTFGCSLRSTILFDHPTLESLANYIVAELVQVDNKQQKFSDTSNSTLVPIQTQGSKPPLFLIPGVMGNIFYLQPLIRYFSPEQPVYGLRSLGLDEDVEPYTKIEDIAAHHIESIQTVQSQGPYLIAGHSFGGKVAFEVAQQLSDQGEDIPLLLILDIQPDITDQAKVIAHWSPTQYLIHLTQELSLTLGKDLILQPKSLESLQFTEQISYLAELLQVSDLNYTKTDLLRLFKVYRANNQAMIDYKVQKIYPNPMTLLRARERDASYNFFFPDRQATQDDPTWGWSQLSTQSLTFSMVPGSHFTMMMEPNVQVLADQFIKAMNQSIKSL